MYSLGDYEQELANIHSSMKGRFMLSPGDVAIIRAEIDRLEKARRECIDGGLPKQIEVWIDQQKRKLISADSR